MLNRKTFGHRKASRRSAFSLVELSIVLIIIGLLISGIIGGASLIKSATLRAVMTEARGYNIASSAFYTKYSAYPGDYSQVVNGTITTASSDVGDGNGTIEYVNGSSATVSGAEGLIAIKQLYNDGSLDASMFNTYTTTIPTYGTVTAVAAMTPRTHIPGGKIKNSGWFFDNYNKLSVTYNVAVLSGGGAAATYTASTALAYASDFTNYPVTPILLPQDAKSIDVKMDDSLPHAGNVRVVAAKLAGGTTANTYSCTNVATGTAPGATDAYGSGTTVNCALGFRVDVN